MKARIKALAFATLCACGILTTCPRPGLARDNAFHRAIETGNIEQAADILRISPEQINATITMGDCHTKSYSPLCWAVEYSQIAMAKFLIDNHAKMDDVCREDYSSHPVCWASSGRTHYISPLRLAINKEQVDMVQLLVDQGAGLDYMAPLRTAIGGGTDKKGMEIVRLLLLHGADVNASFDRENKGQGGTESPLEVAIDSGSAVLVSFLLKEGAYPRGLNEAHTPLEYALGKNRPNPEVVEALLANGANPLYRRGGNWPLVAAARAGLYQVVVAMIEKYSVPVGQIPNDILFTLIEEHCGVPCWVTSQDYFDGRGDGCKDKANQESAIDCAKVAGYLIARKHGLAAIDGEGNTPLHVAVSENRVNLVHLMVENGADLNARNKKFFTPMGLAINESKVGISRYLGEKGAKE